MLDRGLFIGKDAVEDELVLCNYDAVFVLQLPLLHSFAVGKMLTGLSEALR